MHVSERLIGREWGSSNVLSGPLSKWANILAHLFGGLGLGVSKETSRFPTGLKGARWEADSSRTLERKSPPLLPSRPWSMSTASSCERQEETLWIQFPQRSSAPGSPDQPSQGNAGRLHTAPFIPSGSPSTNWFITLMTLTLLWGCFHVSRLGMPSQH